MNKPPFDAQAAMIGTLLATQARLAHALLLHGSRGIGKAAVAAAVAKGLLCETAAGERPGGLACDRCGPCRWFDAGNHPDVRQLGLLVKEGKLATEISINQVRELEEFIGMTAFRNGARIVLIDPAETMNVPAANALLKMLEEPGQRTHFLLVTHRPDALPATVRSRCRSVVVPAAEREEALAWLGAEADIASAQASLLLAFAGGSALHARNLADPARLTAYRSLLEAIGSLPDTASVAVADVMAAAETAQWYSLLQRWIGDLARVCAGAEPRFFPESETRLRQLSRRCSPTGLARAGARLQRQAVLVRHPLNPRLFVEESLALYLEAFEHPAGVESAVGATRSSRNVFERI